MLQPPWPWPLPATSLHQLPHESMSTPATCHPHVVRVDLGKSFFIYRSVPVRLPNRALLVPWRPPACRRTRVTVVIRAAMFVGKERSLCRLGRLYLI